MKQWAPLAIAAPAAAVAIFLAACLGLATIGLHPFWRWEPVTLSEAAATRDAGEVARLIEEGQDPNRAYRVRDGLLDGRGGELTPLEAAQIGQRPEIVDLLLDYGARPGAPAGTP